MFTVCHCVAGEKALADAGIPYSAIEQACVGYVYGKSMSGGFHNMYHLETTFSENYTNYTLVMKYLNIYSTRRLHMWTESHISQLGPDWHPHRERQQQLLHRLHRALHGTAARFGW